MAQLEAQLRAFAKKTGLDMQTAVRSAVVQMSSSMVQLSPVDTGRFRGAWVANSLHEQPKVTDKAGAASLARIAAAVNDWRPGQSLLIANNLPYAQRLEHGWSKQAPAGMVRVSVMNFEGWLASAIKGVR